jgi:hypothetical protein
MIIGESKVNNKQRTILITGAAVFLYILFTSPKISIVKGTYVIPPVDKKDIAKMVDVGTAMTRAVAVLGATLLIFFALKDKKGARTQSADPKAPLDGGYCQENEMPQVKKDLMGRIFEFLRNFF